MTKITDGDTFAEFFPKVDPEDFHKYLEAADKVADLRVRPERMALFLANVAHESAFLTKLEENMNYSATRLAQVWPNRFQVVGKKGLPNTLARQMAHKPQLLANHVYGDRMGNGPATSGDGWRFRGRGAGGLTGRSMYAKVSKVLGLGDLLLREPDLVATPEYALLTFAAWWVINDMNRFADDIARKVLTKDPKTGKVVYDPMLAGRRKVNGGLNGIKEVKKLFQIFMN